MSIEGLNSVLGQSDLFGSIVFQILKEIIFSEITRVDTGHDGEDMDDDWLMIECDLDQHCLVGLHRGTFRIGTRVVVEKGWMGNDCRIVRTPLDRIGAESVEVRWLDEQGIDSGVGEDRLGNTRLKINGVEEKIGDRRAKEDLSIRLKEHFAQGIRLRHNQLAEIGVSKGVIMEKEMFDIET